MKHSIALMVGAAVVAAALSGPALSQGTPQTVTIMKVDPSSLTTGYRTSKVVGSTVVNEANETVRSWRATWPSQQTATVELPRTFILCRYRARCRRPASVLLSVPTNALRRGLPLGFRTLRGQAAPNSMQARRGAGDPIH